MSQRKVPEFSLMRTMPSFMNPYMTRRSLCRMWTLFPGGPLMGAHHALHRGHMFIHVIH
jgi:hypothetical protein